MRCVLCARRNKVTEGDSHVCVACGSWLQTQVAEVARLAADAAAWVAPGSSSGGGSRPVPGSRPPCRVDALDPWFTVVDGQELTVLECLELWERMVREMRGLSPYGPASAARSAVAARSGDAGYDATLTGVVRFLGAQVAWMSTEPEFPVEDFADEVSSCVRVLRRWDTTAERGTAYVVECPHAIDSGTCGYRLRISGEDAETYFHCPRCATEWSVDRLMLVWAETSDAAMWLDAEAVTRRYGVDRTTLERWVRNGKVSKWHGLYDVRPLALAQRRGA